MSSNPDTENRIPELAKKVLSLARDSIALRFRFFDKTLSELKQTLEEMAANTENAVKLCARCLNYSETKDDYIECLNKLFKIDELILKSEATELASLLFPTKNLLEIEMNYIPVNERFQGENDFRKNVYRSKIIYTKTDEVLKRWLKGLF